MNKFSVRFWKLVSTSTALLKMLSKRSQKDRLLSDIMAFSLPPCPLTFLGHCYCWLLQFFLKVFHSGMLIHCISWSSRWHTFLLFTSSISFPRSCPSFLLFPLHVPFSKNKQTKKKTLLFLWLLLKNSKLMDTEPSLRIQSESP